MKGMKRGLTIGQKIRFAFYVTAAIALGITVPFAAAASGAVFVGFALLGAFMPLVFGYITESAIAVATEKKRNRAEEEMLEESNNNFKSHSVKTIINENASKKSKADEDLKRNLKSVDGKVVFPEPPVKEVKNDLDLSVYRKADNFPSGRELSDEEMRKYFKNETKKPTELNLEEVDWSK